MSAPMASTVTALLMDEQPISASTVVNVLRRQNQIGTVVQELVLDQALEQVKLSADEEERLIEEFCKQQKLESEEAFVAFLQTRQLEPNLLLQIVSRPHKIVRYREERWGPRANSLYLQHKERYDLVTYRRLQCADADVMQEVYFRLKDGEESWKSLAQQFHRSNSSANGRIGPVPVGTLEEAVLSALRQQGPGRVCRPINLGKQVAVVELEAFQPSEFNDELRTRILREEFEHWLKQECSKMLSKLTYPA